MADIALGREFDAERLRVRARELAAENAYLIALVGLMIVAALLRFWDLEAKALHHDESLHAQYTWYLYEGRGFKHDPLMHGTFLFHSGAVIYFLFGDGDYTSRVLPALFGVALVGMPWFLRRQIGMKAVLIAAVLLTFSPTILYYSRFYRNELYMLVWTFGIVICMWRYLDEQKPKYLYIMAALLALSFATKEVTFITAAIIIIFLDLMLAVELGRRRDSEVVDDFSVLARTLLLIPFAWLIAAAWPLLAKQPFGRDRLPPVGDILIVFGTLSLPNFSAAIQVVAGNDGYNVASEDSLRMTTVLVLIIASAYVGLLWRPRIWLVAAAFFFVPFVLLFTTFFTNQPAPWTEAFWHARGGFFSGIWGSLDYWLDQHHVKRGNQPIYYYALMTPLYEFLPLLLTLGGAAWLALKGDSLRRWLLFWIAGIFAGLSVAGEKMPWLEAHIALPLVLAAAVALAGALDALGFAGRRWLTAGYVAAATALAVLLLVEADGVLQLAGWLLLAGLGGWVAATAFADGRQAFARAALTVAVAALFLLTVRAGITASFENDDTPVEMLVYTQTSPDIPDLRDRIDAIGRESGLGFNLPIVIDNADGFAWPWAWYLRDYHAVSYVTPTEAGWRPPENAVLLIARGSIASVSGAGFTQTPYRHRWWFAETYRNLTPSKVVDTLTSKDGLESLGRFFLHRRPVTNQNVGSTDAVAYLPDSLAAFDVNRAPAGPAPEPKTLDDGRLLFGQPGGNAGEMQQPSDLFVDAAGNIWVADARNNRVQKFDATGKHLATSGPELRLNEPWSLAVAADGFVYVADTWNHRIVKLTPDLRLVAAFGEPGAGANAGPLAFFGPRDIVIAGDGSLLVSDTGNKRLIHLTSEGDSIATYGAEGSALGQFHEPVGLAFDSQGRLYVADTWNARIQRFEAFSESPVAFAAGWTSREVIAKPYIAVLSDGRIVASEPAKGVLMLFDRDGRKLGEWRPNQDALPLGVAARPDGGFVFADGRRGEVQSVPAAAVDRLFR